MKTLFSCLISFCFILSQLAFGQTPEGLKFIKDEANLLTRTAKSNLDKKLRDYEAKTSNEIAIFIFNSSSGKDLKTWAGDVARQYKIGKQGKDNGILLLIAMQDRKLHFEIGYGLEGRVSDLASKKILDEIIKPQFRQQKYYEALDEAIDKLIELIGNEYTAQDEPNIKPANDDNQANSSDRNDIWWTLGAFGALAGGGYLAMRAIGQASQRARQRHAEDMLQNAYQVYKQADWGLMKKYFVAEDVDKIQNYFQEQLQIYTPPQWKDLSKIQLLSSQIQKNLLTQDNESLYFYQLQSSELLRLRPDFELKKLVNHLTQDSTAILNNQVYHAKKRADFQALIQQENAFFANKDKFTSEEQSRLQNTLQQLRQLAEHPNLILGYDMNYLETYIQNFLQRQDWEAYKLQFTERSVKATQKLFEQKYKDAQTSIGEEKYRVLQELYQQYILVFETNRMRFFEEIPQQNYTSYQSNSGTTYGTNTTIIASTYSDTSQYNDYKDYSDTSTYSDYKDYSDSSSSYSDSYSDSSFGGGDFGGGGSSGDW
jgi:uncharacterized membrane protein YgcG